jgi:hypothetical protein
MRSLEVLIVRDNKIKTVEGPFADLKDCNEKQLRKGVMKLQLLDLRNNKLSRVCLDKAFQFLSETVVLMWNNPFEDDIDTMLKIPQHILLEDFDEWKVPNPLHLFTSR